MYFHYKFISAHSQVWECTPVTHVLGELRSEGSLSYLVLHCHCPQRKK